MLVPPIETYLPTSIHRILNQNLGQRQIPSVALMTCTGHDVRLRAGIPGLLGAAFEAEVPRAALRTSPPPPPHHTPAKDTSNVFLDWGQNHHQPPRSQSGLPLPVGVLMGGEVGGTINKERHKWPPFRCNVQSKVEAVNDTKWKVHSIDNNSNQAWVWKISECTSSADPV